MNNGWIYGLELKKKIVMELNQINSNRCMIVYVTLVDNLFITTVSICRNFWKYAMNSIRNQHYFRSNKIEILKKFMHEIYSNCKGFDLIRYRTYWIGSKIQFVYESKDSKQYKKRFDINIPTAPIPYVSRPIELKSVNQTRNS